MSGPRCQVPGVRSHLIVTLDSGRQLWIRITLSADDSRRLEAIQREVVRAWITHDRSILDRLLAPEWMVTHADGRMSTREEVLREFDSGGNRLLEGRVEDVKDV